MLYVLASKADKNLRRHCIHDMLCAVYDGLDGSEVDEGEILLVLGESETNHSSLHPWVGQGGAVSMEIGIHMDGTGKKSI